jgi:PAS domain S-box-containing protein
MMLRSHKYATAVRRVEERVMAKSSGGPPGLVAAGATEHVRLIRELKLDQTRLKSLNQELRGARAQLRKSLHHYSDLYDFAPVGYVVFDATGSIREINMAGAELLGARRDHLIGQWFAQFLDRKDATTFREHLRRCRTRHGPLSTELSLLTMSGEVIAVELLSAPFARQGIRAAYCRTVIRDISERHRAERVLRQTRQDYETLVHSVEGIVWEANTHDSQFTFVSQQARRLLGYPAERWLRNRTFWKNRLHPKDREWVLKFRAQAIATRKDCVLEYRMIRADRRIVWLRDSLSVSQDAGGHLKLRGIMVNITVRKEAEEALRRVYDDLEVRIKERTAELTASNVELLREIGERKRLEKELVEISEKERRRIGQNLHDDLGQLLTGIAFMTQSLAEKLAEASLPEVSDAAKIQTLVNQAISHARVLSRDLTSAEFDETNLAASLQALARHVGGLFEASCSFRSEGTIPPVSEGMARQLFYIAQEAATNAIKHGRPRHVRIVLAGLPDRLSLTIRNDGAPFSGPSAANTGMGLRIMNYRARVIGATFEIGTDREGATVMQCAVPMKPGSK